MKLIICISILFISYLSDALNIERNSNFNPNDVISGESMTLFRKRRSTFTYKDLLWSDFPIKYKIFSNVNRTLVQTAIKSFERESCIRFKEMSKNFTGAGLYFEFDKEHCYSSHNGPRIDVAPQTIGIAKRCERLGSVIHEVLHALGIFHEHSRRDRNKYVTIIEKNIIPEHKVQFKIVEDYEGKTYGIPYDYGSAMHYERAAGGIQNRTTIVPKNKHYTKSMGQTTYFSFADIKLLNFRYCDHKCPRKLQCHRGGFSDSNNCRVCKCPTFYSPPFCYLLKRSPKICGSRVKIATRTTKTFKINGIKSCYYVIRALPNRRVKITILSGQSKLTPICQPGSGLNIKFLKNRVVSPVAFCGKIKNYIITSEGKDVAIHYAGKSKSDYYSIAYQQI
uniref:Metalloendopeptidase n=1 Tax=Strongyloides papillosus TaxID=174720 RepID=A0A0N5BK28_STREA